MCPSYLFDSRESTDQRPVAVTVQDLIRNISDSLHLVPSRRQLTGPLLLSPVFVDDDHRNQSRTVGIEAILSYFHST